MKYVASSAIIIRPIDNKVFITKRSMNKKFSPRKWEIVGGGIEVKETPEQCLHREVKEELGVEIKSFKYFGDYPCKHTNDKNIMSKVFIVELANQPQPNKEDMMDWGWFSKEKIEKMDFATNCKNRILDYFKQIENK